MTKKSGDGGQVDGRMVGLAGEVKATAEAAGGSVLPTPGAERSRVLQAQHDAAISKMVPAASAPANIAVVSAR